MQRKGLLNLVHFLSVQYDFYNIGAGKREKLFSRAWDKTMKQ